MFDLVRWVGDGLVDSSVPNDDDFETNRSKESRAEIGYKDVYA